MKYISIIIFLFVSFSAYAKVRTIEEWYKLYTRKCTTRIYICKKNTEKMLGKMISYSDMVFKYLDKENLPRWLALVPAVESSYTDNAISKKGALGLWQIMPYNIEEYRTKNIVILDREFTITPNDEKIKSYGFNPVVSTSIAAKHFTMLFERFSMYPEKEMLAIYAYNFGITGVLRWKAGKVQLPEETQNYYNKIMALKKIVNDHKKLGIFPKHKKRIFILEYITGF